MRKRYCLAAFSLILLGIFTILLIQDWNIMPKTKDIFYLEITFFMLAELVYLFKKPTNDKKI